VADDARAELFEYLINEVYAQPQRSRDTHHWVMNRDWLQYLYDTLAGYWEPPQRGTYLYGYEVVVDEKYGIPKLVERG